MLRFDCRRNSAPDANGSLRTCLQTRRIPRYRSCAVARKTHCRSLQIAYTHILFRLYSYLLISSSTRSRVDGVYSRLGAAFAGASISSNGISIRGVTRLDVCGCISIAHAVRRRFHRSKSSECRRFASSSIQSSNALGLSRLNVSSGIPRAVKAYACSRKMSIFSPLSFFLTLWHSRH